jgi:hypothetical protein
MEEVLTLLRLQIDVPSERTRGRSHRRGTAHFASRKRRRGLRSCTCLLRQGHLCLNGLRRGRSQDTEGSDEVTPGGIAPRGLPPRRRDAMSCTTCPNRPNGKQEIAKHVLAIGSAT